MANRKPSFLFLAARRNNLSLIAEGITRSIAQGRVSVMSATLGPIDLHPIAVKVMEEIGIRISGLPRRTPLDIDIFMFDLVITLGNFDQSCRPELAGMPPHIHWNVVDPSIMLSTEDLQENLRKARDWLQAKISDLFSSEILPALVVTRRNFELILDSLSEAIAACTTDGRIFYFNEAAERITGCNRQDTLGKDWRDAFFGCLENTPSQLSPEVISDQPLGSPIEVEFAQANSEKRMIEITMSPLNSGDMLKVGTLISLKDNTELSALRSRVKHHHSLDKLWGKDPKMLLLFDLIREVAPLDVPVLIEGESGTGKELVANAIHNLSQRRTKPFIAINCGALPEGILESELFGHVRGAFSGAVQNKRGRFELANKGTLFLDELGELSQAMQVKLLRVLQEQEFEPVGSEETIKVDVRVISATNQNLRQMIESKKFRRDLYYRLCVIPLEIPPLRDRRLDIHMLIEHFLDQISNRSGRPLLFPTAEALDAMIRYSWPGNIRELQNVLEDEYVKCHGGAFSTEHLPSEIMTEIEGQKGRAKHSIKPKVAKEKIVIALAQAKGNKKEAAQLLGIGRATLYRYLAEFQLQ